MSLQIWLPLNGDLHNQGLTNITPTLNTNNTIFTTGGKIGSQAITLTKETNDGINLPLYMNKLKTYTQYSMCAWIYMTDAASGHSSTIISSGKWDATNNLNNCCVFALYYVADGKYNYFLIPNLTAWNTRIYISAAKRMDFNKWYHVAITYNGNVTKAYINGEYVGQNAAGGITQQSNTTTVRIGSATYTTGFTLNGKINDVRIYDHCLSAAEVAEIAKGLILHYKLDQNLNILDNCYSYSTFNTSDVSGGWSHWGSAGHQGTYGQNIDKNFIYHKQNTYSHWWANGSTATSNYLLYQSPTFEGGIRSLQAILKEENDQPITESICFPAWNARNGGTLANKWTDIISLGNGFYLCKCEGISQDGSNDLVGIHVRPGYKVYISEAYLENNREICSDIFNQNNSTTIYDCSGYGNDGTIVGSLTAAAGSPRYEVAIQFPGSARIETSTFTSEIKTLACWAKTTKNKSTSQQIVSDSASGLTISFYNGTIISYFGSSGHGTGSKCTLGSEYKENEWNHFVVIKTGSGTRDVYCNGIKLTPTSNDYWGAATGFWVGARNASNGNAFYGEISDVRAYATALTSEQVVDLFHTSATIDASGNIYARELKEV